MTEYGWVIEKNDSDADSPCYLAFVTGIGYTGLRWHSDSRFALRFARRQDGDDLLTALRSISNDLPYRHTLAGLRPADPAPMVCEHGWDDNGRPLPEGGRSND